MEAEFKPKHRPGRTYVMCHMIADTDEELHAMADAIGVLRKWHQGDHYDITKTMRAKAVRLGAREITMRQCGCMVFFKRKNQPMPVPETAEDAMAAALGFK